MNVFFYKFTFLTFVNVEDFHVIVQVDLGEKLGLLVSPFVVLLFELAMADGVLDPAEENLLRMTPSIFGIDLNFPL